MFQCSRYFGKTRPPRHDLECRMIPVIAYSPFGRLIRTM